MKNKISCLMIACFFLAACGGCEGKKNPPTGETKTNIQSMEQNFQVPDKEDESETESEASAQYPGDINVEEALPGTGQEPSENSDIIVLPDVPFV